MEPHDEQQARVVERLRAANGAPVSFAELREMGVENPALLCYELAAVGLEIERPRDPRGALALSVRLRPTSDGQPGYQGQPELGGQVDRHRSTQGSDSFAARAAAVLVRRPRLRVSRLRSLPASRPILLTGAALVVVAAAAVALALSAHSGKTVASLSADHRRERAPMRHTKTGDTRSQQPQQASASGHRPTHTAGAAAHAQAKQATVSPTTAAALEAEGHQLLAAGHYAAAIGDLQGAVQASGGSVSRCAEPTSEACLTFAYALYDLGRALQLDGDSAAAVSVLSERLRIANQRETVQQELDLARAASAS